MMLAGTVTEQYRCLLDILTCPVCNDLVNEAHICPNCSKFYCLACIDRQLKIQQKCLNCSHFLNSSMLSNCQQLCADLTQTLEKVKQRGSKATTSRHANDKSPYYCYRHKLEKTYYCKTCDRPLCSDCSVLTQTHRGHQFIKLSIIKNDFKHKMSQKLEQIKIFSKNIEQKIKVLSPGEETKRTQEDSSFARVQTSMKSLQEQLRRKLKKTLNDGERKLDLFNDELEQWNFAYEEGLNILKNTSKGKFVQKEFLRVEQGLLSLLNRIKIIEGDMVETNSDVRQKNKISNYISPQEYTFVFTIENFKEKRKNEEFLFTETVTTKQGLQLRLKIYPKGIQQTQEQKDSPKMTKKYSKNEDYLSIFIELVDGPVSSTKLKHQLILSSCLQEGKTFVREFENEFQVGVCWGYDHFIKTSQLYDDGYYNHQLDFMEVVLKICPASYLQATRDQLALIRAKQNAVKRQKQHISQLHNLLAEKELPSTEGFIEEGITY